MTKQAWLIWMKRLREQRKQEGAQKRDIHKFDKRGSKGSLQSLLSHFRSERPLLWHRAHCNAGDKFTNLTRTHKHSRSTIIPFSCSSR